jgi:tetratricopeptide (TPR) repeat protein
LSDIANAKTAAENSVTSFFEDKSVSIRVSPNSYFIALLLGTFFGAFFIYLEIDFWAVLLLGLCVTALPALALTDRIAFDGKRLRRTGVLPRAWAWISGFHYRLKLSDVEQIETQAARALKRGGSVFYRYRTAVSGRGLKFVFASGGEEYRRMIRQIFPRVSENVLDNRSLELRDYLSEPKEVLMKAQFEHIPSADVLEDSVNNFQKLVRTKEANLFQNEPTGAAEIEKADYLRRLANELRLSGHLLQALEAFRRALVIQPNDAWLLFEAARCLNSFAGSERDRKLLRKSLAMLRLAEKRARHDKELLARLGESYFQFGDWERARSVFQKSIDLVEENFRSLRGMAEIALREGKIAHVIHNFLAANRLAETPALRRWTQSEADYFSHLNDDEEYMEMEISRINLLETLENSKKTALKIAFLGFPPILIGVAASETLISNIGWAVSSVALLIWAGLQMSLGLFSERIPYELIEEIED